jgi:hypothetical protein
MVLITHTLLSHRETGPLCYKLEVCPTLWASYYGATNFRLRPHQKEPLCCHNDGLWPA